MALKRDIGFGILMLLAVNALIGTGIYFAPGIAAFIAGPASLISWVAVSALAMVIALCFAELSSLTSKSGGVYEYTKMAFGNFTGFMVGWMSWILANVTIAMLIIGGVSYLRVLFDFPVSVGLIIAVSFVLFMNYINYRGISLSVKILLGFAVVTVSLLVLIMIFGIPNFDITRIVPFFVFPAVSIFVAMYFILETFFGWESVTFLAEETKDPQKNIPKVMIYGTFAVVILVLATVFISLTSQNWQSLASSSAPLLELVMSWNPIVLLILTLLVFLNVMGSAAAWIISTPRLVYSMARDNVLPKFLSSVHPKTKTPHYAIATQAAITIFVLSLGDFRALLEVVLPIAIIMYSIVILSVTELRKKMPNAKRMFKVPFPRVVPQLTVVALILIFLMGFSMSGVLLGVSLVMLGIPLYLIASLGYHEKFIRQFNNAIALFTYRTYKWFIGGDVLEHLYNYVSILTVNRVLDIGCGVGVVTHHLAKTIPLDGKIYGIDFAKRELDLARRHQKQRNIKNLCYIEADLYNLHEKKKLDKTLKHLDAVVGIGVLAYLPDPIKILADMRKRLQRDGRFYFIDYDFPTHLFDKPWIEDDKKIKKVFGAAGFDVKIWRQKKFFCQFVHMYGIKK